MIKNTEIRICCHCKKKAPVQRYEYVLGNALCKECCEKFNIEWRDKF